MGGFAAVSVLHYLVAGRNVVRTEDEEAAKRIAGDRQP